MGERYRAIRVERGMTRREVSIAIGVTEATVGNWEKNVTEPTAGFIVKLCQLYGVSADELLGRNG